MRKQFLYISIIFLLGFLSDAHAQKKKFGALNFPGFTTGLEYNPNGSLWLVTNYGQVFTAKNSTAGWEEVQLPDSLLKPFKEIQFRAIRFFDAQHGVIIGKILNPKNGEYNVIYRTADAGATWKQIALPIYTEGVMGNVDYMPTTDLYAASIYTHPKGYGWLRIGAIICYTSDFGLDWQILPSKIATKVGKGFFMADNITGIVASYDKLLISQNNWETFDKIPTPLSQKKFTASKKDYKAKSISNTIIWKDYYICKQNGRFYYTKQDQIEWQAFSDQIKHIIPTHGQHIYGVKGEPVKVYGIDMIDNFHLVKFDDIDKEIPLANGQKMESNLLSGFVAKNGVCYVFGGKTYYIIQDDKLTSNTYQTNTPLRVDIRKTCTTSKGKWGCFKGGLYWSDDDGKSWYYQTKLNSFRGVPYEITSRNDQVYVWFGEHCLKYNTEKEKFVKVKLKNPLSPFLKDEITSIRINIDYAPLLGEEKTIIKDYKVMDGQLTCHSFEVDNIDQELPSQTFPVSQLKSLLMTFNNDPYALPQWSDFEISQKEIDKLKTTYENMDENLFKLRFLQSPKLQRATVISQLGTITATTPEMISQAMMRTKYDDYSLLSFKITNKSGDKLQFLYPFNKRIMNGGYPLWVKYNGFYFNCFDPKLNAFMMSLLSEQIAKGNLKFDVMHKILEYQNIEQR